MVARNRSGQVITHPRNFVKEEGIHQNLSTTKKRKKKEKKKRKKEGESKLYIVTVLITLVRVLSYNCAILLLGFIVYFGPFQYHKEDKDPTSC